MGIFLMDMRLVYTGRMLIDDQYGKTGAACILTVRFGRMNVR
jgi:hypothetical protein